MSLQQFLLEILQIGSFLFPSLRCGTTVRVAGVGAVVAQALLPEPVSGKGRLFTPAAQGPALTSASAAAGFTGPDLVWSPRLWRQVSPKMPCKRCSAWLPRPLSSFGPTPGPRLQLASRLLWTRAKRRKQVSARFLQVLCQCIRRGYGESPTTTTSCRRPQEPEPLPWTKLWTGLGRTKVV